MKYFLLCALLLCGAFFSHNSNAQAVEPCPNGGMLMNNMCVNPASETVNGFVLTHPADPPALFGITGQGSTREEAFNKMKPLILANLSTRGPSYIDRVINYMPTDECEITYSDTRYVVNHIYDTNYLRSIYQFFVYQTRTTNGMCSRLAHGNNATDCIDCIFENGTISLSTRRETIYECPTDGQAQFNLGPVQLGGTNYCFYQAYQDDEQCDCNNFRGSSLTTANTFRAPKGQYSNANPPQCVMQQEFVAGRDKPLTCTCQVSAQKWMSTNSGFENGVEYERWETLPVQNGQPSGTFTGVKCGSTDGGPLEPEDNAPKDCFTLSNGVRWCWADPAEKCQMVNGQEQCASGCGRVNGDFVCYNDDPPVTPPRDKTDPNPVNDGIADPNKSINDMIKADFKDINSGTEQRLDNTIIAINNASTSVDSVGDKVEATNTKLDNIGRQLDGTGKDIGEIKDLIKGAIEDGGNGDGVGSGGEFESPGMGAGDCIENCSWYESGYPDGIIGIWQEHSDGLKQTPMFEFLNQFSQLSASGAQPDWNMCFNFGAAGDFGCKSVEIPAIIWAFIKIMILCTAAFLCRALIFGG